MATAIHRSGDAGVVCGAEPLLSATLRRAGIPVHRAVLRVGDPPAGAVPVRGWSATASHGGEPSVVFAAAVRCTRSGGSRAGEVVRSVVTRWAATTGPREVLLAEPRSFCAGVERAIEAVRRSLSTVDGPVFVRKQVVHNSHVVHELEALGAVFVEELDDVPEGATVVFSAHGVSPAVRAQAAEQHLDVIDATCPLVSKVHAEALRFTGRGDTVVFIGHAGHEETEGTMGHAPERMRLVGSVDDVANLDVPDPERVSYLSQTTLAVDETRDIVAALRHRFPALRGPKSDDICYATTNRQHALHAIAAEADLVLVLGSPNSSNSVRLVELSRRLGTPAHLIDDLGDIRPEWVADARRVGLTAGASAPPQLVTDVLSALRGLGPLQTTTHRVATETVTFAVPQKAQRR
ncbi:4-hydroxy-3-methylbut-2-enyl diphosphate reductase [Lentzea xinjiangensis]|uniref:4-hydroxy-3-methylbut-2-enyl diphosphate reductase n=1 Tax=Lentzea xinjiangensis TaxID=402600 RepID=UPI001FE34ADF|nr:4-hydroxy-3-methylbut-2-enyl diphosphate reductase [Lentzea xinjiangensis]